MIEQKWWVVTFSDGSTEEAFGKPRFNKDGTVVYFEQFYGVTGGLIPERTVTYSLASVRKWQVKP